ncbi:ABC transporter permease [Amycolatopsis sp. H20-H5]|uniref:ABC transporter permease n=1 Tax=Amycolatopsis sp. H20-H5 TaxID=3046309 RepID=UPI002DBED53D|nr:ABC transporter permease [Amycolatopsis sp. H20-H5]MEC3975734.1 ABC transporter permease [Amycolatopsis sp. H20-H5]
MTDEAATLPGGKTGRVPTRTPKPGFLGRLRDALHFRNSAAVYLFIAMFVIFALWVPRTFLSWGIWRSLISNQSITCLIAVGLVVPIAAGVVDLAVGTEVGLSTVLVAKLLVDAQVSIPLAILLAILVGAAVGALSWSLIVLARIPSFIATLGVSSVLTAAIAWVSSSEQIVNLPPGFGELGTGQLFGLTYPFYIMLIVAVILWYVLEKTPLGRKVYATGGNVDAMGGNSENAALAGVRTKRIILFALITSGVVSALAGVLITSQLSMGDPTVGPGYLLPVIAAVFFGSTQFRAGRVNIWGTVVAAYVLATGVKGLQLAGLPIWIPDLFNGVALLGAVALAAWRRPQVGRREAIMRLLRGYSPAARERRRVRRSALLARLSGVVTLTAAADEQGASPGQLPTARRLRRGLGFRNIAAIYLFIGLFVVFAVWIPDSFLQWDTWRSLISNQAITCLVALGLVLPIAAGALDLAIGTEVGLGTILVAKLLVGTGLGIPVAILVALAAGAACGVLSWLMITKARVPSFIATLGVSSLLLAMISWVSDSQQIVNLPAAFGTIATGRLLGLTYPFYIMLVVAFALWYLMERTSVGRKVYATGSNPSAARLSGVRTSRILLFALTTCGLVSGLSGVLLSAELSTGDPTVGPGYLLPVIAAVFLGSTQFRAGRVNIWGTVVAAYVLATGVKGLQLAGLPIWIPDLFNGVALLLAVGLAAYQRIPRARKPKAAAPTSPPTPAAVAGVG